MSWFGLRSCQRADQGQLDAATGKILQTPGTQQRLRELSRD